MPAADDSGRPPGRRRAGHRGRRRWEAGRRLLPSPAFAGTTALMVAAVGAVVVSSGATHPSPAGAADPDVQTVSVHLPSSSAPADPTSHPAVLAERAGEVGLLAERSAPDDVSRDVDRDTLQERAEVQADQRLTALADLADAAEQRADELQQQQIRQRRAERRAERLAERLAERRAERQADQWVLPVAGYQITATFGETSYLWSTVHTGLDFAAPEGSALVAVAQGTITDTTYDGAYGNKTVLTLADGTEIWYCHQSSQAVSVGDVVAPGETIGAVGATGNVTGAHLHLEVRPGGGDPVDPYDVLVEHGLSP